jgi:hypothetical protein
VWNTVRERANAACTAASAGGPGTPAFDQRLGHVPVGVAPGRQRLAHTRGAQAQSNVEYANLVANTVMLSNVADLTEVRCAMANDWHPVTADLVACISPYIREHIRRFGRFHGECRDHEVATITGPALTVGTKPTPNRFQLLRIYACQSGAHTSLEDI